MALTASKPVGVRRSAWAIRILFGLSGVLFGSWASRLPALATAAAADESGVALALVGLNLGAVLGLRLGGRLVIRYGSRNTLRIAAPALALVLLGLLPADRPVGLGAALLIFGAVVSVCDVALNDHGLRVEDLLGRPLLSGMHASFSLGVGVGSLLGAALEALEVSLAAGFLGVAVVTLPAGAVVARRLLPDPATSVHRPGRPPGPGWSPRLVAVGLLAFCAALAEGAANEWAALYLHEVAGASTSAAALGFAGFAAAMFAGRLLGDRLTSAWGSVITFRAGAGFAAATLALALLWPEPIPATVALVGCGLGVSFTLPVAIAAGGRIAGLDRTRAVANTTTLGYLGFFSGPALIGGIAALHGLTAGLALPAVLLAGAAVAAGALGRTRPRRSASIVDRDCS